MPSPYELLIVWLAAVAGGSALSPVAEPTEVVIVGTIHGDHGSNTRYSAEILRDIIVALEPEAILVELPPTIGGRPTVVAGRRASWLATTAEGWAQNAAASELGVPLVPFDRQGRNEYYARTRYFARRDSASSQLRTVVERIRRDDSTALVPLLHDIYRAISRSQRSLHRDAPPEVINSAAFDELIRAKRRMDGEVVLHLADAGPEHVRLVEEYRFIGNEWAERNAVMAENILRIAGRYRERRIVVLTGAEHRYALRERLARAEGIVLREFWELVAGASR